ncbi:MAG: MFS transporter, partial [Longimicrobiales bacterium]
MEKHHAHPLRGLLIAQFLGAFNDNAWKMIVILLAYRELEGPGGPGAQRIATLAMVVFIVPLILFSLPAGIVADRISKRTVILAMKGVELVLMAAALVVLFVSPTASVPAYAIIGLMGAQSALFGPAKYGILPEILPHNRLSQGNGLMQLWTFAAIVLGQAAAGLLLVWVGGAVWIAGAVLTGLAVVGLLAAFWVPRVAAARGEGGLIDTLSGAARAIRGERVLLFTVVGLVLFWAIGSLIGQNVLVYGRLDLQLPEALTGAPIAILAIGIGAGSLLASKLSASKV